MKNILEQIERLRLNAQDLNESIRDTRDELSLIEANEKINIATAKDLATGKPLFTNDTMRDAALVTNLAENTSYQTLKKKLKAEEAKRVYVDAEIERLRGLFKLYLLDRQENLAASLTQTTIV